MVMCLDGRFSRFVVLHADQLRARNVKGRKGDLEDEIICKGCKWRKKKYSGRTSLTECNERKRRVMSESGFDNAVELLDNAGLLPVKRDQIANIEDYDELDQLIMGAPPAAKFAAIGDILAGKIVRVFATQVTDFDTREPQWWDDGSPKLQVVVVVDSAADGLLSLYAGSRGLRDALREACRDARAGLRPGGTLAVRYVRDGEPFRKGVNPPKIYEAAYDPPDRRPVNPVAAAMAENVSRDRSQPAEPPF